MATINREFRNVFQLAADWQRQPQTILAAAKAVGIEPASRYSGLALFSPEQCQAIERELTESGKCQ